MIPLDECKEGWTYQVVARNATAGIFDPKQRGFVIRRVKFDMVFLFSEYHWEVEDAFEIFGNMAKGTAMPILEIEKAPEFRDDNDKIEYLKGIEDKLEARFGLTFWSHKEHKCHWHPESDAYFEIDGNRACAECAEKSQS